MKTRILLITALALAAALTGCKTSEKNYREAYERTIARDNERADFDETVYGRYRRAVKSTPTVTESGDTLDVRSTFVTVTPDGGGIAENLKKYCVVAAEFKQLFNARSVQRRLVDGGVPGAFIVQTREPFYYVVAGSYSDFAEAEALLQKMKTASPLPLKPPSPYILTPSQIR